MRGIRLSLCLVIVFATALYAADKKAPNDAKLIASAMSAAPKSVVKRTNAIPAPKARPWESPSPADSSQSHSHTRMNGRIIAPCTVVD